MPPAAAPARPAQNRVFMQNFAFVFAFECGSRAANGVQGAAHESFIFAAVDDDSSIDLH